MEKKQTFGPNKKQISAEEMDRQLDELYGDSHREAAGSAEGGKANKKQKKRGGRILAAVLGVVLALLVAGGVYVYWLMHRPQDLFTESVANVTEEPKAELMEPAFDLSGFATPEATEEPSGSAEAPAATEAPTDAPTAEPTDEPTDAPVVVTTAPPVVVTTAAPVVVTTAVPTAAPTAVAEAEPTAVPEADPTPVTEVQDNIVNIMIIGLDAFESGGTTSGTEPHADVMMVVAVNFDKNKVDLITLPRDIFTTAPGLHGFYKLNGVFNAGGGMKNIEGGLDLTCRAAEIWLGGITIPYYYAVDFQAVVDIVDAIGGIDYDVDQPFTAYHLRSGDLSIGGKHYDKGMQHLDGDAVLQYLRIRQEADGLDSSRTARQRRMMVAIFNKLKNEGKLTQIPKLINAAASGIYTNTSLSQTTALATFAMTNIDPEQIRTRSISGDIWYQHYFKYVFVDQQNRINIIKEVYGIDAEPIGVNTPQYENWLYKIGFLAMKYVRQPEKVFTVIQEQKDAGKTFTNDQIAAYAACYQAYTALDEGFTAWSERVQKAYVDGSMTEAQIKALEKESKTELQALNAAVKKTTQALQTSFGTHVRTEWEVGERWFVDTDINEVLVYFG